MNSIARSQTLPFNSVALLLQGGGALGAYQGGVYQALDEAGISPSWVAGISIGAINGAIIAGAAPGTGVKTLRAFWETITASPLWNDVSACDALVAHGNDTARGMWSYVNAALALARGVPGFFTPRLPWQDPAHIWQATSYYDTSEFKNTLEKFVDFKRVNNGQTRLSVGAVNIKTGNFVYFDTADRTIGPEHIMASGALPPSLPAVAVEGDYYWDGGLISNTPLQYVMEMTPPGDKGDTLAFHVDLWSSDGDYPRNMLEVNTREKEIRYSSRTRNEIDRFKAAQKLRFAFSKLYEKLPAELRDLEETKLLHEAANTNVYSIAHLIYRAKNYENHFKDFEFSRLSMDEHWRAGYADTINTLKNPAVLARPTSPDGIATYDMNKA